MVDSTCKCAPKADTSPRQPVQNFLYDLFRAVSDRRRLELLCYNLCHWIESLDWLVHGSPVARFVYIIHHFVSKFLLHGHVHRPSLSSYVLRAGGCCTAKDLVQGTPHEHPTPNEPSMVTFKAWTIFLSLEHIAIS